MKNQEYTFTGDQRALLKEALELVSQTQGEPFYLDFGKSEAYDGVRIGIEGHEDQPLFLIHSAPHAASVTFIFTKLGPPPNFEPIEVTKHSEFSEAVRKVKAQLIEFVNEAKAPFRQLHLPAFSNKDRQILTGLAGVLGRSSNREPFIDFQDIAKGAQACAIGVIDNGQTILVATFVSVPTVTGIECSVRNFQNQQVPGMPSVFPSVAQAIAQHQGYFSAMVSTLKGKPWWKRLF